MFINKKDIDIIEQEDFERNLNNDYLALLDYKPLHYWGLDNPKFFCYLICIIQMVRHFPDMMPILNEISLKNFKVLIDELKPSIETGEKENEIIEEEIIIKGKKRKILENRKEKKNKRLKEICKKTYMELYKLNVFDTEYEPINEDDIEKLANKIEQGSLILCYSNCINQIINREKFLINVSLKRICPMCKFLNYSDQPPMTYLQVVAPKTLGKDKKCTLPQLMQSCFGKQQVIESFTCPSCKETPSQSSYQYVNWNFLGKYILIYFERLNNEGNSKDLRPVQFHKWYKGKDFFKSEEDLTFSENEKEDLEKIYNYRLKLKGIFSHNSVELEEGGQSYLGGHWMCHLLLPRFEKYYQNNEGFFYFNDSSDGRYDEKMSEAEDISSKLVSGWLFEVDKENEQEMEIQ